MRRTTVLLVFVLLLVALFACAAYEWMNVSAELSDARQQQQYQRSQIELLHSLARHTAVGMSRRDLKNMLSTISDKDAVIKEDKDRLELDEIVFKMRDDHVIDIILLGDEGSPR